MSGRIFLIDDTNSKLVSMQETSYDSEALLQRLLAQYPDLLAGDQMNAEQPRRWLLISREMAVPDEEDGAPRWSLDHLFLDQDAIPTLIEVKRSSDTRIRREVVGQMLDYAANAVAYWPVEEITTKFEMRCEQEGKDPAEVFAEFTAHERDPTDFWQLAKTNLQAGRIRLVFVADVIPTELRRIVEFLNEQMDPAEVLAVEIRQFLGEGMKTLVPRVLGLTESARQKKDAARPIKRQWDEPSFFAELTSRRGATVASIARRLLDWAAANDLRIWWGQGTRNGSFIPVLDNANGKHFFFSAWTTGQVEIQFQYMNSTPFDATEERLELANRLRHIEGVVIAESALTKRPSVDMSLLEAEKAEGFLAAFDWALEEIYRALETD